MEQHEVGITQQDEHVLSNTYNCDEDSSTCAQHGRGRRRPRPRPRGAAGGSLAAALTLGVALAGAVASAASGGNPPPPPPPPSAGAGMSNGNYDGNTQQDRPRWAGWTDPPPPPPPPPPPSQPVPRGAGGYWGGVAGNGAVGVTEQSHDELCESSPGMEGAVGGPPHHGGAGTATGMGHRRVLISHGQQGGGNSQVGGEFSGHDQQGQQQHPRGMMGAGGGDGQQNNVEQRSQGNGSSKRNGIAQHYSTLQQQQSLHDRVMSVQQGRGEVGSSPSSASRDYLGEQEGQETQAPPSIWRTDADMSPPPLPSGNEHADRFYGNTPRNSAALPRQQQQHFGGGHDRAEAGMMGGAGNGRWGSGMQKPPPSHGNAGAVTPKVKFSEYRQGATGAAASAAAGGRSGEASGEGGDIPRALLSNTDKEVIFDGLKKLYRKKILPLEESSRYAHFHSPPMNPADFEAKPMVLIVGQYSVGKTSFIRSLLKKDFPGQRVGPEPTTDRFVAVTHGEDERVMPGHALAMQADKPFRSLQQFGNNFLTKFEGSVVDAPILRNITLVDTPGVLSGEKQRIGRDYDFASVISWFAERADLIVVMFDAHKLDISDELKMVIDTLKPHHDKMRVLLNKADTIDTQQLMRVYGALMWSLGKVMQTPEVCRVYIGSFWEAPLSNFENKLLLEREKNDLLEELMLLPENAVVRRINELVKRARSVKVHAYIIHYLRKQMPYVMGKQDKQEKLIRRLDQEFLACARRYGLPLGDFPKVEKFRRSLREIKDISKFKSLDKSLVHEMDKVFSEDIPKLMEKAARPGSSR